MRMPFRCERAPRRAPWAGLAAVACWLLASGPALAQMPDLTQMSGTPLPADDLPTGTVSVRLVRGDLTNAVVGHPVELHGGVTMRVTTDETGRATFTGVPPGGSVHAHVEIEGQSLSSQNFPMPASGGVKLILLVGAAGAAGTPAPVEGGAAPAAPAAPTGPATPGTVVLGGQSRLGVEFTEDGVDVYMLFDLANTATGPVSTEPLVFEVPDGATSLTVLENSSPQAKTDGRRFVVTGPFAPGLTSVQLAYRLPVSSSRVAFAQPLPVAMVTPNVLVRKFGAMQFRSPQAGSARDVTMQDGTPYVMATGQQLAAGSVLEVELTEVPHHSRLPRYLALGLAVFIIGFGVWLTVNGPDERLAAERRKLEDQRETLLGRLVELERQKGSGDAARLAARREDLLAQLERIYAQLDRDAERTAFEAAKAAEAGAARAARAQAASR